MPDRYVVRSAIAAEQGSARDGERIFQPAPKGFQIYDTHEEKRSRETYMTRGEAQEECDRRNGR